MFQQSNNGPELTERWHDQTLVMNSLQFDKNQRVVTFQIIEEDLGSALRIIKVPFLHVFRVPLQLAKVTGSNVDDVVVESDPDELELLIDEVKVDANSIVVLGSIGRIAFLGDDVEFEIQTQPFDNYDSMYFSIGLIEMSWRVNKNRSRKGRVVQT